MRPSIKVQTTARMPALTMHHYVSDEDMHQAKSLDISCNSAR